MIFTIPPSYERNIVIRHDVTGGKMTVYLVAVNHICLEIYVVIEYIPLISQGKMLSK